MDCHCHKTMKIIATENRKHTLNLTQESDGNVYALVFKVIKDSLI